MGQHTTPPLSHPPPLTPYLIGPAPLQKLLSRRKAPFHILITSYQLVVTDAKYFQRVKWQYMILDEAQAIKSSNRSEGGREGRGGEVCVTTELCPPVCAGRSC